MTWKSATPRNRQLKRLPQQWNAHAYQKRASDFLVSHGVGALFLDPGLGKTAIVLDAFQRLKEQGVADKMLVIAPLLPAKTVWAQEGSKWTNFRDLTFTLVHGSKKKDALKASADTDITLINPEGLAWLRKETWGRALPWDTVVFDELTKFKSHRAQRSKLARKMFEDVARKWGLTGTPAPNGYEDLFGQILLLDGGNALGKYMTHFRDRYFEPDGFTGYNYKLSKGADKVIEARIAPLVLRMSAEDYLELPPLVDDVRRLDMAKKERVAYDKMRKEMLLELPGGVITAQNAAAAYNKLSQMANGAVYFDNEVPGASRQFAAVHDVKLDAIEELVEELAGQPLLVAYEFHHDLKRLRERFGADVPVLKSGMSQDKLEGLVRDWNAGAIPLLFAHPASAGHGLNLQEGGASHLCWYSTTWNLELYDQFIRRLYRQGSKADRVINHILCVNDTIDEIKMQAIRDKDTTQARLLQALNAEIGVETTQEETDTMPIKKLRRQTDDAAQEEETKPKPAPRGWGRRATASDEPEEQTQQDTSDDDDDEEQQRENIRSRLTKAKKKAKVVEDNDEEEPPVDAKSAFSKSVQDKLGGEEAEEEAEAEAKPKPAKKAAKKTTKAAKNLPPAEAGGYNGPVTGPTPEQIDGIVRAFETTVRAILGR